MDDFKPAHWRLEAKFREFMTAIALACDGKTASIDPKITGDSKNPAPTSAAAQDIAHWTREFRRRRTDRTRLELLKEIQRYVSQLSFAPADRTQPGTLEWREKVAFDERRAEDVCDVYGISKATLYRIRQGVNLTRPRRRYYQ